MGFLTALLILVSAFNFGISPIHPPKLPVELTNLSLISPTPTVSPTPTPDDEKFIPCLTPPPSPDNVKPENGTEFHERIDKDCKNYDEPEKPKIPAYNIKSDKEMPTDLPQESLDHSKALEPLPSVSITQEPSITPIPTEPQEESNDIKIPGPGIVINTPETPVQNTNSNDNSPKDHPGIATGYENLNQNINPNLK